MNKHIENLISTWKKSFSNSEFRNRFIISLIVLGIVLFFYPKYLEFNEARIGFRFDDPFLSLFTPINVTWITFGLLYIGLMAAIFDLTRHPSELLIIIQSYAILVSIRLLMMFSLPLEPPELLIPLVDPFVQLFGNGQVLEKDLFFSGHTSLMFLLFLTSKSRKLKAVFLICTIIIGLAVLIQHVHYTVDVLVAPFIAYTSFKIAKTINK